MDQYRPRLKLSENFERHWSIRISGEIHMDRSLVHTFSWENSYGPMILKVLLKFPPTLALVHGWLFPAAEGRERRMLKLWKCCGGPSAIHSSLWAKWVYSSLTAEPWWEGFTTNKNKISRRPDKGKLLGSAAHFLFSWGGGVGRYLLRFP